MKLYKDEDKIQQNKKTYLTKDVHKLLWKEKVRLKKLGRKVSIQKLVNNSIIEKYGDVPLLRM